MSSIAAGQTFHELNQSVSSAYLNKRPLRSAPTQSITRLASSASGHVSSVAANNSYQNNTYQSHSAFSGGGDQIVYCDPKTGEVESQIERAIIQADNPLPFDNLEQEEIELSGAVAAAAAGGNEPSGQERAILLNKEENASWRGPMPLEQYRINVDPNPTVIMKKPKEKLKYKQEVHIKYLKPPTPKPSELVIVQEPNRQLPPAPPLIIRQAAPRQPTPEPLIIREAPPHIPEPVRRVVHVPGKVLQAPARKVILERLPMPPQKPQQVIIERWLKPRIPPPRVIVCKPMEQQECMPQSQQYYHHSCCGQPQRMYDCPPSTAGHYPCDRNDIVISIFLE